MSHQYGTIETIERLSPSMIRIIFDGNGLDGFEPTEFSIHLTCVATAHPNQTK